MCILVIACNEFYQLGLVIIMLAVIALAANLFFLDVVVEDEG